MTNSIIIIITITIANVIIIVINGVNIIVVTASSRRDQMHSIRVPWTTIIATTTNSIAGTNNTWS